VKKWLAHGILVKGRRMNELEMLEKAIGIAVTAHEGQKDRYGAPYIFHPLRVMARVQTAREKTVAILHDVVEDTDWTFEKLRREGFPEEIISALDCLTKREKEPYEDLVRRSAGNPLARPVKIADLEDNMDIRRMPEVADEAKARLEKYLRAWRSLTGG
jgi:(p)ppGpp synthase/HD superfamily hydrolase